MEFFKVDRGYSRQEGLSGGSKTRPPWPFWSFADAIMKSVWPRKARILGSAFSRYNPILIDHPSAQASHHLQRDIGITLDLHTISLWHRCEFVWLCRLASLQFRSSLASFAQRLLGFIVVSFSLVFTHRLFGLVGISFPLPFLSKELAVEWEMFWICSPPSGRSCQRCFCSIVSECKSYVCRVSRKAHWNKTSLDD